MDEESKLNFAIVLYSLTSSLIVFLYFLVEGFLLQTVSCANSVWALRSLQLR